MTPLRTVWLKARALLRIRSTEQDLHDEMSYHLEMLSRKFEEEGFPPDEARRAARRKFGNLERQKEACREARRTRTLEEWSFDLRHGMKMIRRAPGFSLLLIGILSVAIAGVVFGFSLVKAYVVRPLPFDDSERLVWILRGPDRETFANPQGLDLIEWDQVDAFESTIAWDLDAFNLTGRQGPEAVDGIWISPSTFRTLGIQPAVGRLFDEMDLREGRRPMVISHALWQRRWGGDSTIVGQPVRAASADRPFDENLHTVIGVLPADFWFFNRFNEVMLPLDDPDRMPTLAMLAPGVGLEAAQASLDAVVSRHVTGVPDGWHMALITAQDEHTHEARPIVWALVAAVAALLLVSCANVAGALVARGARRRRELAVRSALGAGRGRIFRQLISESLGLGLVAGLLGTGLAAGALMLAGPELERRLGATVPGGVGALVPDATVVAGAALVALLVSLLFGMLPGWTATRIEGTRALGSERGRIGSGRGGSRARDGLVVAQIALTLTLLVGAGLMLRTVDRLTNVPLGFDPDGVTRATLMLPADRYETGAARNAFAERLRTELGQRAGVEEIALGFPYPFRPGGTLSVHPAGAAADVEAEARTWVVDPGWFDALDVEVTRGRPFDARDGDGAPMVTVVSGSLAERLWPGRDPLGRQLAVGEPGEDIRTVVGVVPEVRKNLTDERTPDLYIPYAQSPTRAIAVLLRTPGEQSIAPSVIERTVRAIDPDLPVEEVEPLTETIARSGGGQRFLSLLLAGLGAFAALLAAVGLYSTIAYSVRQRRQEYAVRLALGASPRRLLSRVLLQGGAQVAVGLALGLAGSILASRTLRSQLFGVEPTDPASYFTAVCLLGVVALLAIVVPAMRAGSVDPARVLQED